MEKVKLFFKGFYAGFKSFGLTISTIVNFVLLMIVYFIGVGLTSLLGKTFKKRFLYLKKEDRKKSYWIKVNKKKQKLKNYRRMF